MVLLVRGEDDLQAALLSRLWAPVCRDHPARPTARPLRDEAAEQAAVVGSPAVRAFGRAREAGEEQGRDAAAGEQPQGGREGGTGREALSVEDQVPGGVALVLGEVRQALIRLGAPQGER
jgi:hypothetical protein